MAHILCLDDDASLTALSARMLESCGHGVSAFTSADEALACFRAKPGAVDLVLTDMSMPGMNGLEFAQAILEIRPGTPVVIATGCVAPNWAEHARAAGVRAVIEKPTTPQAMASAIDPWLRLLSDAARPDKP